MQCLRCGHCCIHYEAVIILDPDKGLAPGNARVKHTGERCPHLQGDSPGAYSCAIHDHPIYPQTPCYEFTQVGKDSDPCRMGEYILSRTPKS